MYKHGQPVYRVTRRPLFVISILVLAALAAAYILIIKPKTGTTFSGSTKVRITNIKGTSSNDTAVDEPLFTATLPGPWKLAAVDSDARYHSYQWTSSNTKSAGRWFKVFVDSIPPTQAVNYMLPVTGSGAGLSVGAMSDNCVNFTQGAVPEAQRPINIPLNQASLPSRWEMVNFLCDNAEVSLQVVGAASTDGINTVTLTGPTKGTHKFFFMYEDSNISPDYGQFDKILTSFKVK